MISEHLLKRLIDSPVIPDRDEQAAASAMKICAKAEALFKIRCTYKQAEDAQVTILPSYRYYACGLRYKWVSIAEIGLANPMLWEQEVHNQHISIVDGRLTLAMIEGNLQEAIVLLAEQGRGMAIHPAIATIRCVNDTWQVQGKPDKNHPALEILCTKQRPLEVTDGLYSSYLMYRSRPIMNEIEEQLLGSNPKPRSIIASGSDKIN